MVRESEADKIKWFKGKLQKSIDEAKYKKSCRHDKEKARYMIDCCFNWGLFSLRELIEMRVKVDKEIKKDNQKLIELVVNYKLLFCLTALEEYTLMSRNYAFFCDRENKKIDESEIEKRSEVLKILITGISEYPNLSDELIDYSQEILGKRYTKKFLNRCYRKKS